MVDMYFYRTSNGSVSVKVGQSGGYRYQRGTGRSIRDNYGEDRDKYPLIVSFNALDSFMEANNIDYKEVSIAKESVDKFYGFFDNWNGTWTISKTLSPNFIDEWWNYDCPNLYRITPNKSGGTNMLGVELPYFKTQLCEAGLYNVYIDESITEEEVSKITSGREGTVIHKEMSLTLKAKEVPEERIETMKKYVKNYESKIQKVVDDNSLEITMAASGVEDGFPCGFLHIYTTDEKYNEYKSLLRNLDKENTYAKWMDVKLPRLVQCLTIKEQQFNALKEIVKRDLNVNLYSQSVLD